MSGAVCGCRNLADEHMPPSERIGDAEASRLGLLRTADCQPHRPVTSPARGGPDTAGMREVLDNLVDERLLMTGVVRDGSRQQVAEFVVDALLPVVQRLAVEKAAEELRAAADGIEALSSHAYDEDDEAYEDAARRLRLRAAALAAAAQPADGRTGE